MIFDSTTVSLLNYFIALSGDWSDQKCHVDLPYVCKRVNVTGTIPPTPAPPLIPAGCPQGWSPFLHKVKIHKNSALL